MGYDLDEKSEVGPLQQSQKMMYEVPDDRSGLEVSAIKNAQINIGESQGPIQISNSMEMDNATGGRVSPTKSNQNAQIAIN